LLQRAERVLRANGHHLIFSPTRGPHTAGAIASESIRDGADLILVAGGDGTINEAINGMVHSPVPLGVLPAGTANVLCAELGLGLDVERAAANLVQCRPARVSLGRICLENGPRHFLLMAGIGLDAQIVYKVSLPLKAKWGKIAYWIAGFSLLGRRLTEFGVEIDGQAASCSFALVSKVRNYGGDLEIARDTSLFDNQFEVVLFSGKSSIRYLKYLAGVALKRVAGLRGVTVRRACRVKCAPVADRRVYVQVDGELTGYTPVTVEIVPDALTLLVPPAYFRKHAVADGRPAPPVSF